MWRSNDGTHVVLASPSNLLQLTELERITLQKVALCRVQAMNLGTKINIPKGLLHIHLSHTKYLAQSVNK